MKKSAKINYIYNTLYTILNMFLPLITVPYISRILGASGIGTYAYSYSIAQYFVLIAKLGLVNYGTREISKTKNKEKKSEIFSNLFFMQVISTLLISIVYIIYFLIYVKTNQIISIIFFIWILFSFLDIDWFWFGEEEFKKVSIRNIVIKLLTIIAIFALVNSKEKVWLYTLIMVLGYIIGYISIWIGLKNRIEFSKIKMSIIKKHVTPCAIMLIPVLALNIYRSMDKVMLGAISGMEETGIYENGEKLIYCLSSLISSLGTVMMPKISYLVEIKDEEKVQEYILKSLKYILIMTSSISFGLMAVANNIVPIIFGSEFTKSSLILFLCSPILLFMGWSNVIRTQYIIPYKLDKIYVKSILYGSIINLICNFIFIPKYGSIGAVIGTLLAESFVPIYQFLKLRTILPYKKYITKILIYPIIGFIMFVILKCIESFINSSTLSLIIQIIVGGLIYASLVYIYIKKKDKELYQYIINILKIKGVKK